MQGHAQTSETPPPPDGERYDVREERRSRKQLSCAGTLDAARWNLPKGGGDKPILVSPALVSHSSALTL